MIQRQQSTTLSPYMALYDILIIANYPKVQEELNYLKETIEDDLEYLQLSKMQTQKPGTMLQRARVKLVWRYKALWQYSK